MKKDVEYRFAKDEDGNLVDANVFDPSERRIRKCYCLSCGNPLIPVLGYIRKRHFRHEADKPCNGETYLHELGKRMLKKRWDESSSFVITFPQEKIKKCSRDCPLKDEKCQRTESGNRQDLKKYYQTCSVEKTVKNEHGVFKADLLLENESDRYPPMMLEVCVTHPCSEEKQTSGIRIVEFTVKSEEDAFSLYSAAQPQKDGINFYGIQKTSVTELTDDVSRRITKADLYAPGKIICQDISCKSIESTEVDGYAVAFFNPSDIYFYPTDPARMFFAARGFNIKSCEICSNLKMDAGGNTYCCCFNKRPYPEHAYFCSQYNPFSLESFPVYYLDSPSLRQNPGLYKSVPPTPLTDPGFEYGSVGDKTGNDEEKGYRFAKYEDGNIVDAELFNPSAPGIRKCYCLSCGEELVFSSDKAAKRHFRHTTDKPCNGETYLHELGKMLLKMRWDKTPSFVIAFPKEITQKCAFNCLLNNNCSKTESVNRQDLKKFYQTCSVDKEIKNENGEFKADLLLEDQTGKYDPMMLEVCVTHPCSDEKQKSGIRIAEFTVKSEESALFLYFEDLWWYKGFNYYSIPKASSVVPSLDISRRIMRAALHKSGKIVWRIVDCKSVELTNENEIAVAFFVYRPNRIYPTNPARLFFAEKGFNIKSCEICSYLKEAVGGDYYCCFFDKRPFLDHAYFCSQYSPNMALLEELVSEYYLESPSLQQNPELYKSVPATPLTDQGFRYKFV